MSESISRNLPSFVPSCVTRKQTEKWCAKSNVSKTLSLHCLRQRTSKSSIPKAFAPSRGVHRCSDDVFLMMYSALLNTRYWSQSFTCAMRHSHATSCCVVGHTSQTAKSTATRHLKKPQRRRFSPQQIKHCPIMRARLDGKVR